MLLALLGTISALSFAPGPLPALTLPFVQVVVLTCLAGYVFNAPSPRHAAWAGFLFGLGQFAVGLYWIFISLHQYGSLPSPLAASAVFVLAAGQALYFTLATAVARWLCNSSSPSRSQQFLDAAAWASCWAGAEWLRGTLLTGFPWLSTGYAHADGPLSGWAALFGIYGLAWISAYIAAAIALLARSRAKAGKTVLATAIVLALAGVGLKQISWATPIGPPLLVRLVQGNVPQSEKFDPQLMQKGIDTYMRLAALPLKEAGTDSRLIVLPETIMPMFQDRYPAQPWLQWKAIAREQHATLLMSVPLHTEEYGIDRYTNSTIALNADTPVEQLLSGAMPMRYDKHHLVPFGEFIPTGFCWFVNAMHIPLGNFDRGAARQRPFNLDGQMLAPNICY